MIPAFERTKIVHSLDRTATVIGTREINCYYILIILILVPLNAAYHFVCVALTEQVHQSSMSQFPNAEWVIKQEPRYFGRHLPLGDSSSFYFWLGSLL
jgi:hypothetical protein